MQYTRRTVKEQRKNLKNATMKENDRNMFFERELSPKYKTTALRDTTRATLRKRSSMSSAGAAARNGFKAHPTTEANLAHSFARHDASRTTRHARHGTREHGTRCSRFVDNSIPTCDKFSSVQKCHEARLLFTQRVKQDSNITQIGFQFCHVVHSNQKEDGPLTYWWLTGTIRINVNRSPTSAPKESSHQKYLPTRICDCFISLVMTFLCTSGEHPILAFFASTMFPSTALTQR